MSKDTVTYLSAKVKELENRIVALEKNQIAQSDENIERQRHQTFQTSQTFP